MRGPQYGWFWGIIADGFFDGSTTFAAGPGARGAVYPHGRLPTTRFPAAHPSLPRRPLDAVPPGGGGRRPPPARFCPRPGGAGASDRRYRGRSETVGLRVDAADGRSLRDLV